MIVVLLVAWAAVLAPTLLARRHSDRRAEFEQTMGTLATATRAEAKMPGRWVMVPKGPRTQPVMRRERVVARRRAAFERLMVVAAATFVIALVPGLRAFFFAHLAADLALIGYGLWLKREKSADLAARRIKRAEAKHAERERRLERQEMLQAQQEHIAEALASSEPEIVEPEVRRVAGDI